MARVCRFTHPKSSSTKEIGNLAVNYLLAVGQLSNSIARYAIDHETGSPGQLGEDAVGTDPSSVEIIELGT
ncbi:MAG TPA: hypothetical protein VGD80_10055 [Kofleriaceae bacterium]